MSRNNKRTEAAREPDNSAPLTQLDSVMREASGKLEQVRRRVERDLKREAARIERDSAADEAERDLLHDDLKEGDIEILRIMTVNQQSEYDVYANSPGPSSTRPLDG